MRRPPLRLGEAYTHVTRVFVPVALRVARNRGDTWCCCVGESYYVAISLCEADAGELVHFGVGSITADEAEPYDLARDPVRIFPKT